MMDTLPWTPGLLVLLVGLGKPHSTYTPLPLHSTYGWKNSSEKECNSPVTSVVPVAHICFPCLVQMHNDIPNDLKLQNILLIVVLTARQNQEG